MILKSRIKEWDVAIKSIGIVSGREGEGTTTMALAMGTYASQLLAKKTAIVFFPDSHEFSDIKNIYFGKKDMEEFRLFKMDYYYLDNQTVLSDVFNKGYEYIIMDFGKNYRKNITEFLRCGKKIVMGSVNLWRYDTYLSLCEDMKHYHGSDIWLHIISGDSYDIKAHIKKHGINGVERIMIKSPYIIEKDYLEFFEKVCG